MYEIWSCVTFYHLFNKFLQPNDNCISTSWKWFNREDIQDIHGFILNWTFLKFLDFYEKIPLQKEQDSQKLLLMNKKNSEHFKIVPGKRKNFKAIWVVLARLKPKILSVGQPWWPRPWPPNCFGAALALHVCHCWKCWKSLITLCYLHDFFLWSFISFWPRMK